ncbi:MAG: AAA family ATPase [Endozoicomonadaceae bacterium]|nr:AAA family ATPase [Endozoicomonadaceae bacterium]
MKLESITLKNFRCFKQLTIKLHPNLTILIAPNGAGKTTLLDAARIAVWPFVKAFDLGAQTGKAATLQIEDVHRVKNKRNMEAIIPAKIISTGFWGDNDKAITWTQTRKHVTARSNTLADANTRLLMTWSRKLQQQIRNTTVDNLPKADNTDLPLVAYLGTGRLWYQGRHTSFAKNKKLNKNTYSRIWGYHNCLTASSSYKQFEDWYSWIYRSYREQQIISLEKNQPLNEQGKYFQAMIMVVQQAVNQVTKTITGWEDIAYSESQQQQIVLSHPEQGEMPLSMLSDGVRNVVVMVADIAFRCSRLNPHWGEDAALKTTGVVLIDEVDMFLHPDWQQTIIHSLQKAFPRIQFIVTTHSPQVLSTVPKECIRLLTENISGDAVAAVPLAHSYGEPSNNILQAIMHVDPQPPIPEKKLIEYLTEMVDKGLYKETTESLGNLELLQTLIEIDQELAKKLIMTLNPKNTNVNLEAIPQKKLSTLFFKVLLKSELPFSSLLTIFLKERLNPNHPQMGRIERSMRRQEAIKKYIKSEKF